MDVLSRVNGLAMDFPHILHRGTALVVPSYCYKLFMAAANGLLVAYGLFQSAKTSQDDKAGAGRHTIEFPLDGIEVLVVNHVHVDDLGRFPCQLAAGFVALSIRKPSRASSLAACRSPRVQSISRWTCTTSSPARKTYRFLRRSGCALCASCRLPSASP